MTIGLKFLSDKLLCFISVFFFFPGILSSSFVWSRFLCLLILSDFVFVSVN